MRLLAESDGVDAYRARRATSVHRETEGHLERRDLGSAVLVVQGQTAAVVTQGAEVGLLNHDVHVVRGTLGASWWRHKQTFFSRNF